MKFVATNKGLTTIFFHPSLVAVFGSGIRDPGSGMGKNQDPGSGIWDKHPGSATLNENMGTGTIKKNFIKLFRLLHLLYISSYLAMCRFRSFQTSMHKQNPEFSLWIQPTFTWNN